MKQITLTLSGAPGDFAYYLDLSNFLFESGLSNFRVLSILLVCFVSAAGYHYFH